MRKISFQEKRQQIHNDRQTSPQNSIRVPSRVAAPTNICRGSKGEDQMRVRDKAELDKEGDRAVMHRARMRRRYSKISFH